MQIDALTATTAIDVHEKLGQEISPEGAASLAASGAYAASDDEGVFAIGGLHEIRPGVGLAWTVLSRRWRLYARQITALCMYQIENSEFERIEAATAAGWAPGRLWLERMGFVMETELAQRWDGVNDYSLFVRLKHGNTTDSRRGGRLDGEHDRVGILSSDDGRKRGHVDRESDNRVKEPIGNSRGKCEADRARIA